MPWQQASLFLLVALSAAVLGGLLALRLLESGQKLTRAIGGAQVSAAAWLRPPPGARVKLGDNSLGRIIREAGVPFAWGEPQWIASMGAASLLTVVWGMLAGRMAYSLALAVVWPVLILGGLRRWAKVHATRRAVEARRVYAGCRVLLHGYEVDAALEKIAPTVKILGPVLRRTVRIYRKGEHYRAFSALAQEVPELEPLAQVLSQATRLGLSDIAGFLRQEEDRWRTIRDASADRRSELMDLLGKLITAPSGIAALRLILGALSWIIFQNINF